MVIATVSLALNGAANPRNAFVVSIMLHLPMELVLANLDQVKLILIRKVVNVTTAQGGTNHNKNVFVMKTGFEMTRELVFASLDHTNP